ncbi:MAG: penicillin-binding protein 2 [Acidimicrobiia bacterium]|nr:penicillin-binding protein 2 [Acidimicrobiia bacterium]
MNQAVRRLAVALFVAFGVLVGAATYHQAVAGPEYRDDPRNARLAAGRTGRERGGIVVSDGTVVARSVADPNDSRVFRRDYAEGALYSHVVGYSSLLFGDTGIEAAWASDLGSGRNSTLSGLLIALTGGDVRPKGLRLTINHELQTTAAAALGDQRGAVVVVDAATGAILTMVASPRYDPNTLLGSGASQAGALLESDPSQPLLNRALNQSYPPGSVFKVITAAAALESGLAGPGTEFADPIALELPGSTATIRNFNRGTCGDGTSVTLEVAFVRSCNTVFGELGLLLGAAQLVEQAEAFGLNRAIPFDLEVLDSRIPPAEEFVNNEAGLAQTALGQRDVQVTPIQMALVAAAVANRGEIMTPYLVSEVVNAEGEVVSETEPARWRRVMSPATADVLAELMERVVTSGTGTNAAVPGVRIAGKTGTAEIPDRAPHSWFIGFGPVQPEEGTSTIAFAIVVESGGTVGDEATGGSVAAPIAAQLMATWMAQQGG